MMFCDFNNKSGTSTKSLDNVVDELVFLGSILVILLLALSWLGLIWGLPITRHHLFVGMVVFFIIAAGRWKRPGRRHSLLIAVPSVAALLTLSVLSASFIFDASYDGMMYHQVAVIALSKGWNPITFPHVVDWWLSSFPQEAWLAKTIAGGGIWVDHYPKASWVLGAVVSMATNSLNSSKWPQVYVCLLAILALYRGLAILGVPTINAWVAASLAALSPVSLAQIGTNYVDGLLGSTLALLMGASFSWLANRDSKNLFIMFAALIFAANLKFTGVIYGITLFSLITTFSIRNGWRPRRWGGASTLSGILVALLVSGQTYFHNILAHQHPFYPINQRYLMKNQMPEAFLSQGRVQKFLISSFSAPNNSSKLMPRAQVVLPSLSHYAGLMRVPDTRIAGFGTWFSWSLLLTLVTIAIGIRSIHKKNSKRAMAIMVMAGWVVASACMNPEFWWARYAPQLWLLPILASSLAFLVGSKGIGVLPLVPALLGVSMSMTNRIECLLIQQKEINRQMNQFANHGYVTLLKGWKNDRGIFTFTHYANSQGTAVRFDLSESNCKNRIGIVRVCGDEK